MSEASIKDLMNVITDYENMPHHIPIPEFDRDTEVEVLLRERESAGMTQEQALFDAWMELPLRVSGPRVERDRRGLGLNIIDVDEFARKFVEMFTPDEKAALAFGMLPAVKMRIAGHQLLLKANARACELLDAHYGGTPLNPQNWTVTVEEARGFIQDTLHRLSIACLHHDGCLV